MKKIDDSKVVALNENINSFNEKEGVVSTDSETRDNEKKQCFSEIENICSKFNLRLNAEIIINSSGNHIHIFLEEANRDLKK